MLNVDNSGISPDCEKAHFLHNQGELNLLRRRKNSLLLFLLVIAILVLLTYLLFNGNCVKCACTDSSSTLFIPNGADSIPVPMGCYLNTKIDQGVLCFDKLGATEAPECVQSIPRSPNSLGIFGSTRYTFDIRSKVKKPASSFCFDILDETENVCLASLSNRHTA